MVILQSISKLLVHSPPPGMSIQAHGSIKQGSPLSVRRSSMDLLRKTILQMFEALRPVAAAAEEAAAAASVAAAASAAAWAAAAAADAARQRNSIRRCSAGCGGGGKRRPPAAASASPRDAVAPAAVTEAGAAVEPERARHKSCAKVPE